MGHIHLGTLPGTKRWREVAQLLDDRAGVDEVVAASARAAEKDLRTASGDPALATAVRLLALLPQAARGGDFPAGLRSLGLDVPDDLTLADLTAGAARAFERETASMPRTDFAEMVRRSMVGTLTSAIGDGLPGLFEADARDVQRAAAQLARPEAFARVARMFFGQLLARTLGSWLDRALSAEIGTDRRIGSLGERDAFDQALDQYCFEATRIIREFSAAWYGKTLYREGTISAERAVGFSAVAMTKLVAELSHKSVDRA